MSGEWRISILSECDSIRSPDFVRKWMNVMDVSDAAHVFFHPVIAGLWIESYRPLRDIKPLIIHAVCGEQEVIFPLVLWKRNWKNGFVRMIVPVGHSDFDYHDPVFIKKPSSDEVQGFFKALKTALDKTVCYDRILFDGIHRQFLPEYMQVVHREACLSWPLAEKDVVDGFVLPAKKSLRQDIIRRLRRLQESGQVVFARHDVSDEGKVLDSIDKMLAMHIKRWPNAYKAPGFHQRLIYEGIKAGLLDFIEMRHLGQPIAWQLNFKYKGRYSQYMPSVSEDYLKYSPGHASLGYAFACAKNDGMLVVDHLRGAEGYKSAWGGAETMIYDVAIDRNALSSRFRMFIFNALAHVKSKVRSAASVRDGE